MKILIVGCGAVGQVLGYYLVQAGVDLCFYARKGSAKRMVDIRQHAGLSLYQVSHFHRKNPVRRALAEYQVVSDTPGSLKFEPDHIWFTTPSTVLHTPWYQKFLQRNFSWNPLPD